MKKDLEKAKKILKKGEIIYETDSFLPGVKFLKLQDGGKQYFFYYDYEKNKILDFGEIIEKESDLDKLIKEGWKPVSKVFILDEEFRKQFFLSPSGEKKVIIFHISGDVEKIRDPKIKFKIRRNFVIVEREVFYEKFHIFLGGDWRDPRNHEYYTKYKIYFTFGVFKKEKTIKLLDVKIKELDYIWNFSGGLDRDSWISIGKGLDKDTGSYPVYKQIKLCEFFKNDLDKIISLIVMAKEEEEKVRKKFFE